MIITIEAQIACVQREIGMRRRVYPRWVGSGKMTEAKADLEVAAMESVLATLEEVKANRAYAATGFAGAAPRFVGAAPLEPAMCPQCNAESAEEARSMCAGDIGGGGAGRVGCPMTTSDGSWPTRRRQGNGEG